MKWIPDCKSRIKWVSGNGKCIIGRPQQHECRFRGLSIRIMVTPGWNLVGQKYYGRSSSIMVHGKRNMVGQKYRGLGSFILVDDGRQGVGHLYRGLNEFIMVDGLWKCLGQTYYGFSKFIMVNGRQKWVGQKCSGLSIFMVNGNLRWVGLTSLHLRDFRKSPKRCWHRNQNWQLSKLRQWRHMTCRLGIGGRLRRLLRSSGSQTR